MNEASRKALMYTGLAIVGGATAVAVTVSLIRSTSQRGEGIRLKVSHEVDPKTRTLLSETNTTVKQLAEQGLRVRLFGKPK
jgi:hypothetical protein